MLRSIPSGFLLLLALIHLSAQDPQGEYGTPEEGFARMQNLAGEGRYPEALALGGKILEDHPAYDDVALQMARIYGWEAKYDSAYAILHAILSGKPDQREAHEVLVDLAYWENDWEMLEAYAARALQLDPGAERIRELYLLAKQHRAISGHVPELFMFYSFDHFGQPYSRNWHMLTAGVDLPVANWLLSPYLNAGIHTGTGQATGDLQINLDTYFSLGRKRYAMAGYGVSPRGEVNHLPDHRAAAELWQVLPRGFSLSAGVRYFYWNRHFTFLTLSGEKYAGNFLFTLRSYIFFKDYGISGSYYLSGRRYFRDKFDHVTLTLGYGTAPDEPLDLVTDLERLKATSARLRFSKQIRYNIRMDLMAGYAFEAYAEGMYRHRIDLRAGSYFRLMK